MKYARARTPRSSEQNVSKEPVLIVFSGAEQRGCHEPTDGRKNCDGLRVITDRHHYRSGSDENHQEQGGYLVKQMIETEGSKNGEIQNGNAASKNRHRVPTHFFAMQRLSPGNKSQSGQHADHDAAGFANPLVVDGVLQKVSHPENDGSHADLVQKVAANFGLKTLLKSFRNRGSDGLRRRWLGDTDRTFIGQRRNGKEHRRLEVAEVPLESWEKPMGATGIDVTPKRDSTAWMR